MKLNRTLSANLIKTVITISKKLLYFFCILSVISISDAFAQNKTAKSPQSLGLNFLWPTDASNELTSTFAEYRSTHYHYGIDIKTWNQTGYKVFASEDGYISRIRVGPTGYGKAIYITHKGGYLTVYGHLDDFSGKVKEFVSKTHYKQKKNELNLQLNPKDLKVTRGELIAFTGETGVGTPHLHWEIRDPFENEINPLLLQQIPFIDKTKPVITKVAIKPLTFVSTINGISETKIYSELNFQNESMILPEIPILQGKFGFLLDGYDLSDGGFNKFGFHKIELNIDKNPVYTIEYVDFPIPDAIYILIERDTELQNKGKGRFTRLYQDEKNPLPFYTFSDELRGQISNLSNGRHTADIIVSDITGNKKNLAFQFDYVNEIKKENQVYAQIDYTPVRSKYSLNTENNPTKETKITSKLDLKRFTYFYKFSPAISSSKLSSVESVESSILDNFLKISVTADKIESSEFMISVTNGNENLTPVNIISEDNSVHFLYSVQPDQTAAGFQICISGNDSVLWTEDIPFTFAEQNKISTVRQKSGTQIKIFNETFFKDEWINIEENRNEVNLSDYQIKIGPQFIPVKSSFNIKFPVPFSIKEPSKLGIFQTSRSRLSFVGNQVYDGFISANTKSMGTYVLALDTIPPILERYSPIKDHIQELPKKLKFKAEDKLSGIDSKSISVFADGDWNLAEYDPENDLILVPTEKFRKRKNISLFISVADQLSNKSTLQFNLKVGR